MTNRTKNTASSTSHTNAREELADAAQAARDNVREMGSAAKALAGEQVDHLMTEVAELKRTLTAKVEARPLKSLLIATGAGMLLGMFLRRS